VSGKETEDTAAQQDSLARGRLDRTTRHVHYCYGGYPKFLYQFLH